MKTDQLIVQYLYSNKKVTLQEIGTFTVSPEIIIDSESDKDFALPPDAIRFEYNPKAEQEEGLVNYISDHSRKMKALAASDLESFIILNKQFLNIGKPLIMEGLGTLQKTQVGDYAFTQATTSRVIHEESPKQITEKQKEKISFVTPPKEKNTGNEKSLIGLLLLILVLGAAFAAYYFINKNNKEKNTPATDSPITDSVDVITPPDVVTPVLTPKDSNTFYIVLNEYPGFAAADKRMKVLSGYGHKIMIRTKDSVIYKVMMPFKKSFTDTLGIKDSVAKLLNPKAYIEIP